MRICILSRYHPQLGGIATHSKNLVEELIKRGHEVTIIAYKQMNRKGRKVKIYEIPIIDKFFIRGVSYFLGSLAVLAWIGDRIDIIHCHPIHPAGTIASFFNLFQSMPFIITSHGSDVAKWSTLPLVDKIFSAIANSANKIICVSHFVARKARKIGIKKNKIEVVYNGIDISNDLKRKSKNKLRKELKLPKNRNIVLFVGLLTKEKRPDLLLKFVKKIDADFLFIGNGPLKKQLEKFIKKHNLKNVKLLGSMQHGKTLKFIKAADILAIPSKYEGFGLVALEAMFLGTAVIAKPVASLKEILSSESLTNNFENKIKKILTNKKLKLSIIKKNRDKAKKFTVKRMVDEIEKIYQEVFVASS